MSRTHFNYQLLDCLKTQKYCDVWFNLTEDLNQTRIGSHKLILSLASDVFDTMFFGESVKRGLIQSETYIQIPDIRTHIFDMFLRFIYGEDVKIENLQDAVDFYRVAHRYNCEDAMNFSQVQMKKKLNPQNATTFYESAVLYEITDLKEYCLMTFSQNTWDLLMSSDFLKGQASTIERIFYLEKAAIDSEMDYVKALEKYVSHNKDQDPDIEQKVRPALQSICFLTMMPTQIAQTSLLTDEEVRKLILCLSEDADLALMPPGFSVCRKGRKVTKAVNKHCQTW